MRLRFSGNPNSYLAQETVQQVASRVGGPKVLSNKLSSAVAQFLRELGFLQAPPDKLRQLLAVAYLPGGSEIQHYFDHIAKVVRVRTKRHGGAIGGRLDHVLASTFG